VNTRDIPKRCRRWNPHDLRSFSKIAKRKKAKTVTATGRKMILVKTPIFRLPQK
jgi:hypothetical protein